MAAQWWRSAVIYQVYPRSFADSDGDGVGDLPGITSRLGSIRDLGADAIWLSPFMTSPQHDAGYDVADYCDVDPLFGTLGDFDAMIARATDLDLRVIIDLVPNHTSSDHVWFQAALAAGPGSAERDWYMFRDGKGSDGNVPPNNWQSVFGGSAWTRVTESDGTPGQWYLHLFDISQPDLNWHSKFVRAAFRDILRFWLDRGVDGFRVDVAHGLVKADGLPDYTPPAAVGTTPGAGGSMGGATGGRPGAEDAEDEEPLAPYWGQDGVHEIYREWHEVLAEYDGDRALCGEAWVEPLSRLALWVRPDEMQQTFNFTYLETPWRAQALREVVRSSIDEFGAVGAPSTWVLSNHDVVRHATRLSLTVDSPQGAGLGPRDLKHVPERHFGLRRARAATALMLALPGSAYIYQGEELGLPEVVDLPDDARQDPTWFRTGGERYGRDGCRVPIPWEADAPAYGFSPTGASWLPQPALWAEYARDVQESDPASPLAMYRELIEVRRQRQLGLGTLEFLDGYGEDVIALRNGQVTVIANLGGWDIQVPDGRVIGASEPVGRNLAPDTTVWVVTD
ncbi:glycoside hydrolase family 13 protein [Gryllotalpicola reticulitermitis]|uniref:Glycoside hydrolase family 13 protein n=1 Tax=Gryllotalpicola reticulitermitis TaxID=1184153 RepID=A0ABV8Q8F4_9MICO